MIWTKGTHQNAKFQTFDCSRKISPNLYFDRLLLLKVHKISTKKSIEESCLWVMTLNTDAKFEKKMICCSKNDKNLVKFDLITRNFQNFYFDWFLLCKVYDIWPKKVQRSYFSWHRRVIQNLKKKNWFVVWKMTWGIRPIFTRALESLQIGPLMGSFYPK